MKKKWFTTFLEEYGCSKSIRKLLIANRGLAATKFISSMEEFSYKKFGKQIFYFYGMVIKEDLESNYLYIEKLKNYKLVESGPAHLNYCNIPLIVETAKFFEVDGVWPGWGYSSENPELAKLLQENKLVFLGPSEISMYLLGDKFISLLLCMNLNIPVIPSLVSEKVIEEFGIVFNDTNVIDRERINKLMSDMPGSYINEIDPFVKTYGLPIVFKVSSLGGGKGIGVVRETNELNLVYEKIKKEANNTFIFASKLIENVKHIEIQAAGDCYGNIKIFGSRDCTLQRRNQKLVEECPAMISRGIYKKMKNDAKKLLKKANYVGLATVEFLYDIEKSTYYFLEVNSRIQVEHPVTEILYQINLPVTQWMIASGIKLKRIIKLFNVKKRKIHALAVRITAEDPKKNLEPVTGKISLHFQNNQNNWGYFSVVSGKIHEFSDSQFGHIFSKGKTRTEAVRNMIFALKSLKVENILTPKDFLISVLDSESFLNYRHNTEYINYFLQKNYLNVLGEEDLNFIYFAVVYCLDILKILDSDKNVRNNLIFDFIEKHQKSINVEYLYNTIVYNIELFFISTNSALIKLNNTFKVISYEILSKNLILLKTGKTKLIYLEKEDNLLYNMKIDGCIHKFVLDFNSNNVRSKTAGKIVRFLKNDGQAILKDEKYVEIEIMKMNIFLEAPCSGIIKFTKPCNSYVKENEIIATIQKENKENYVYSTYKFLENVGNELDLKNILFGYYFPPKLKDLPNDVTEKLRYIFLFNKNFKKISFDLIEYILASLISDIEFSFESLNLNEKNNHLSNIGTKDLLISVDEIIMKLNSKNSTLFNLFSKFKRTITHIKFLNLCLLTKMHNDSDNRLNNCCFPKDVLLFSINIVEDNVKDIIIKKYLGIVFGEAIKFSKLNRKSLNVNKIDIQKEKKLSEEKASHQDLLIKNQNIEFKSKRHFGIFILEDDISGIEFAQYDYIFLYNIEKTDFLTNLNNKNVIKIHTDKKYPFVTYDFKPNDMKVHLNQKNISNTNVGKNTAKDFPMQNSQSLNSKYGLKSNNNNKISSQIQNSSEKTHFGDIDINENNEFHDFYKNLAYTSILSKYENSLIDPLLFKYLEIERFRGYESVLIHKCLFRNMFVFLSKANNKRRLFVRFIIDAYSGNTISDMNNLIHAIFQILSTIKILTFKHKTTNNHLLVVVKGNFFFSPVSTYDIIDDCIFFFVDKFLEVNVTECEIKIKLLDKSRDDKITLDNAEEDAKRKRVDFFVILLSHLKGYLEKKIYKNDQLVLYQINSHLIHNTLKNSLITNKNNGKNFFREQKYENCFHSLEDIQDKREIAIKNSTVYYKDLIELFECNFVSCNFSYEIQQLFLHSKNFDAFGINLEKNQESKDLERKNNSYKLNNDVYFIDNSEKESICNGIVGYKISFNGNAFILIANDISFKNGSFSIIEDVFFYLLTLDAMDSCIPRIYISCTSGARIGVYEKIKEEIEICIDPQTTKDTTENMCLIVRENTDDKMTLEAMENKYKITSIFGNVDSGAENLSFSSLMANITTKAYENIFTLSYVTGLSVGIGAYLVKLGNRIIQKNKSPIILTGNRALNKLLKKEFYTNNNDIGGSDIMQANGVSHLVVIDDYQGIEQIVKWLNYYFNSRIMKEKKDDLINSTLLGEKISNILCDEKNDFCKNGVDTKNHSYRNLEYTSSHPFIENKLCTISYQKTGFDKYCSSNYFMENYNEREVLDFILDQDSFTEYMTNYAPNVIIGRGMIMGKTIGVISSETKNIENEIPGEPDTIRKKKIWTKNVMFPETAKKISDSIMNFGKECLDILLLANWKGFSGGTTDMLNYVLDFGSNIIRILSKLKSKILVYLPPNAELRGGTWVIFDKKLNANIRICAHPKTEVGILEPDGLSAIKFKEEERIKVLERSGMEINVENLNKLGHLFCKLHDSTERLIQNNIIDEFVSVDMLRKYLIENVLK
ncbi:acetyl-CoA carboxylase [Hamiltosporidium magnivora]|uniref:Acetyl-CoA carboxylase n=2 Tax=Hamiltosporidium TaxID=1176354 RepID=A0A4Q9LQT8_9MICR|nr:acetyl-CoA carboxylase [Hamiltosporidium magnivora]